jgi:hypothetical protein
LCQTYLIASVSFIFYNNYNKLYGDCQRRKK